MKNNGKNIKKGNVRKKKKLERKINNKGIDLYNILFCLSISCYWNNNGFFSKLL